MDTSAFFMAVRSGDIPDVQAAIVAGVDVNVLDRGHASALHYAAANDDEAMVRILLGHGADSGVKRDYASDTPLMSALREDALRAAAVLLEQPLSQNNLQQALWFAARQGKLEAAVMVLTAGADPDAVSARGDSALGLTRKNPPLAALLREHGATRDVVFTPVRVVPAYSAKFPSTPAPVPEASHWSEQLVSPKVAARTQAAKKLAKLADPGAVPALVGALARELADKRTWKTQVELIHALYLSKAPPEVVKYVRHLRDTLDFTDQEIVPMTIDKHWPV